MWLRCDCRVTVIAAFPCGDLVVTTAPLLRDWCDWRVPYPILRLNNARYLLQHLDPDGVENALEVGRQQVCVERDEVTVQVVEKVTDSLHDTHAQ